MENLASQIGAFLAFVTLSYVAALITGGVAIWRGNKNVAVIKDLPNQVKKQNDDLLDRILQSQSKEDEFKQMLVQRLWTRIDTQDAAHKELEAQVVSLQAKLADRERISNENKQQIIENQKTFDDKIAALQKDSSTMQQDLLQAQEQLNRTKAELETTRNDLVEAKARITQLEAERATTLAEKESLTRELDAERAKVTELQQKVTYLEQEVARLKTELETKSSQAPAPPAEPPKDATP